MDTVKNLICLEDEKISVIRFKSDKLEFIKRDGEITFPITNDFWDWWKKIVSYIDGEKVDICFVYDKEYDLIYKEDIIKNNIINLDDSSWKIEHIKSYFWELKPTYLNLVIVGPEHQKYALNGNNGTALREFYTNLNFNEKYNMEKEPEEKTDVGCKTKISEDNYSEFAKYFIDLLRRERGQ